MENNFKKLIIKPDKDILHSKSNSQNTIYKHKSYNEINDNRITNFNSSSSNENNQWKTKSVIDFYNDSLKINNGINILYLFIFSIIQ